MPAKAGSSATDVEPTIVDPIDAAAADGAADTDLGRMMSEIGRVEEGSRGGSSGTRRAG